MIPVNLEAGFAAAFTIGAGSTRGALRSIGRATTLGALPATMIVLALGSAAVTGSKTPIMPSEPPEIRTNSPNMLHGQVDEWSLPHPGHGDAPVERSPVDPPLRNVHPCIARNVETPFSTGQAAWCTDPRVAPKAGAG
jgi:hypothetical protein